MTLLNERAVYVKQTNKQKQLEAKQQRKERKKDPTTEKYSGVLFAN